VLDTLDPRLLSLTHKAKNNGKLEIVVIFILFAPNYESQTTAKLAIG
jgi:hypothetical protein